MPRTILKYIITGDSSVGKSSLMLQFTRAHFNPTLGLTVGVDVDRRKDVEIEGREFDIEIWDTAGQESYKALTRQYYRDADGCLVVFDLQHRPSFDNVRTWIEHARANACNPNLVVTLVGNKADCPLDKRQVTTGEAFALAAEQGCEYRELSAKDGAAVERVFIGLAERIFKEVELGRQQQEHMVIDGAGRLVRAGSTHSSFGVSPGRSGGDRGTIQLHNSYQKGGGGLCC